MPLPAGHAAGWVDGEGLIDTGLLFFQRISGNWVVVNETIGIQMGKHRKAQRFMGIPPDGFLRIDWQATGKTRISLWRYYC